MIGIRTSAPFFIGLFLSRNDNPGNPLGRGPFFALAAICVGKIANPILLRPSNFTPSRLRSSIWGGKHQRNPLSFEFIEAKRYILIGRDCRPSCLLSRIVEEEKT